MSFEFIRVLIMNQNGFNYSLIKMKHFHKIY